MMMEKIRTITQSANDIDRIEPLFYGLLLFSFTILMIILYCIFCCLQQKQLEDFSFIGNINQQLIDNDQSLLNLPKTKDKKTKLERLTRDTNFKEYTNNSFVKLNLTNNTSSSTSPINTTTSSNSFFNQDLLNLSYSQFKSNKQNIIESNDRPNQFNSISPLFKTDNTRSNQFNPISPLFKSDNAKSNILNPKTIDLFDASQRKVDHKLVASLRLKMIDKMQSKKLNNLKKNDNHN